MGTFHIQTKAGSKRQQTPRIPFELKTQGGSLPGQVELQALVFPFNTVGTTEGCTVGVTGLTGLSFEGILLSEEGGTKPRGPSLSLCGVPSTDMLQLLLKTAVRKGGRGTIQGHPEERPEMIWDL